MKNLLIFFSIFTIAFIAFFDIKDRINELNGIAANTPSQVEMKQQINKENFQMPQTVKSVEPQKPTEQQINQNKMNNKLNNFNKQRETINQQN